MQKDHKSRDEKGVFFLARICQQIQLLDTFFGFSVGTTKLSSMSMFKEMTPELYHSMLVCRTSGPLCSQEHGATRRVLHCTLI